MAKKNEDTKVAEVAVPAQELATQPVGTEVAVKKQAPLPATADEIAAAELLQDAADSAEHLTRDDLMIPFLSVIQTGSPQVKKGKPEFIEEARPGMFINTLTNELFSGDEGVLVLPVFYTINYTEWKPRSKGGGLVNDFGIDDSILKQTKRNEETGRDTLPSGNEIATSGMHYCYLLDNKTFMPQQVVISLSATQLKKSRRWNTLVSTLKVQHPSGRGHFTPARFYMTYRLKTVLEGNDKGDWFGVVIEYEKPVLQLPNGVGPDLYRTARDFSKLASEGKVQVQKIQDSVMATGAGGSSDGGGDDIPF